MLKINNLTFKHPNTSSDLFSSFSFTFQNEITCIVGKNAIGKSSLFEIITDQFIDWKNGKHSLIDFEPDTNLDIIYQRPDLGILPWYSSHNNLKTLSRIKKQDVDEEWFLEQLGIFGIDVNTKSSSLSGGQIQIINILKALAIKPNLLLMDEPFVALDMENIIKLKKVLTTWQSRNKICIIFVSHSLADIVELSDRVIILDQKPIKIVILIDKQDIQKNGISNIKKFFDL